MNGISLPLKGTEFKEYFLPQRIRNEEYMRLFESTHETFNSSIIFKALRRISISDSIH